MAVEIRRSKCRSARGVIVFVHGFAGNRHENGLFNRIAEYTTGEGFHSILYDWRGIRPSQGEFHSTSLREHVDDFKGVVKWARKHFSDCGNTICGVGFSLGAAVMGLALKNERTILNCAVYLSPAVRPSVSMWPRYADLLGEIREKGWVEKPGTSVLIGRKIIDSLRKTDLGDMAFDVGIPLLVCHGTNDDRISCKYSRDIANCRKDKNKSSHFKYMEFEGASHSFKPESYHWAKLARDVTNWFSENASCRQYSINYHDDEWFTKYL